jgi:hypothetical protein
MSPVRVTFNYTHTWQYSLYRIGLEIRIFEVSRKKEGKPQFLLSLDHPLSIKPNNSTPCPTTARIRISQD